MKKLLSIVLAAVMTVSVFALSVVPAMAADTVNSPSATTAVSKGTVFKVNGVVTKNAISFRVSTAADGSEVITYTYTAEGTLKGWEQNLKDLGLVEGTDFTAVQNKDGSYTISYISDAAKAALDNGEVIINAIVDLGTGTTSVTATTKKDDSSKSPATGISSSVVAGGVAIAFAGAAVLAATKKKDAE